MLRIFFRILLPCWNTIISVWNNIVLTWNISATKIISASWLKLFQSNQTRWKLCKCRLLSVHMHVIVNLLRPFPERIFIPFQDGITCWNKIVSLQNCFTLKCFISRWNYFISTSNHNFRFSFSVFLCYVLCSVVSTSAVDCLQRLVCEILCRVGR